jgi:pimeloyl-ACP methyl ester carboxylesterase
MTAAIRGAEHVHVPCAGHMLPQQVPHVINEAIRRTIAVRSSSDAMRPRRLGRAG